MMSSPGTQRSRVYRPAQSNGTCPDHPRSIPEPPHDAESVRACMEPEAEVLWTSLVLAEFGDVTLALTLQCLSERVHLLQMLNVRMQWGRLVLKEWDPVCVISYGLFLCHGLEE